MQSWQTVLTEYSLTHHIFHVHIHMYTRTRTPTHTHTHTHTLYAGLVLSTRHEYTRQYGTHSPEYTKYSLSIGGEGQRCDGILVERHVHNRSPSNRTHVVQSNLKSQHNVTVSVFESITKMFESEVEHCVEH